MGAKTTQKNNTSLKRSFIVLILSSLVLFLPLVISLNDDWRKYEPLLQYLHLIEFVVISPVYVVFFRCSQGMGAGSFSSTTFLNFLFLILIINFTIPFFFSGLSTINFHIDNLIFPDAALMLTIFFLTFIVPIYEEMLFRGCLFRIFLSWFKESFFVSAFLSSFIFSMLHTQNNYLMTHSLLFLDSLIFSVARIQTGGILLPILLHSVMNGSIIVFNYVILSS